MGIVSLCGAISNVVSNSVSDDKIMQGNVVGDYIHVAGKSYSYTIAVDVSISSGDWVYVAIVNNRAVVVGK